MVWMVLMNLLEKELGKSTLGSENSKGKDLR